MILIVIYLLIVTVGFGLAKVNPLRFDFAVTLVWLGSTALNVFPPLVERTHLSGVAIVLLLTSHVSLISGFRLGGGSYPILQPKNMSRATGPPVKVLLLITVLFILASSASALLAGNVPILGMIQRIQSARLEFLEGSAEVTLLEGISRGLKYFAVIIVCLLPVFIKRRNKGCIVIGVLAAVSIIEESLRLGGRADIVFMFIALSLCVAYCLRHYGYAKCHDLGLGGGVLPHFGQFIRVGTK